MMLKTQHINWLFMSYEMSATDITEKLWKLCGYTDNDLNEYNIRAFNQRIKHIITVDDPSIYVGNIKDVWRMVRAQYGVICKGVVIDYLQIIPVKGAVATERAIAVAKAIKELAKAASSLWLILRTTP